MKSLKELLEKQFKDKKFKEKFYKGLEKTRIAAEISYYREKRGITQAQLAKLLGTSQSTVARLEDPFYENYSLNTLRKVAKVLDLELIVSLREKNEQIQDEFIPKKEGDVIYITWIPKNKSEFSYQAVKLGNKDINSIITGEAIAG